MTLSHLIFKTSAKNRSRTLSPVPSLASLCLLIFWLSAISCKQGPKEDTLDLEPVHDMDQVHQNIQLDVHRVRVLEILPAKKYLYLKVQEGDKQYWMATGRTEIRKGENYQYNEALIKKDFQSEELDRHFETLYLVTRLIPDQEANPLKKSELSQALKNPDAKMEDTAVLPDNPEELPQVSLSTLLEEKEAFEGQWITIEGTCIKVNNGIMGRNWVHLANGMGGSEVVLTTQEQVEVGQDVRFAAKVALNRDFGSGYSYPLLMEQGRLLEGP